MRFDAIVIGGGPAGSSTAILLQRQGWRVAIFEKTVRPQHKVCGEFLSPAAWPLLHDLGIAEKIEQTGAPVWDLVLATPFQEKRFPLDAPGLGISRKKLDEILEKDIASQM